MYEIFAKLLQEHNKTPYRVYKDTGISQTTLSEGKNGKVTPKADKLQIIAEYFGVTIDYLMGNEQKENRLNVLFKRCFTGGERGI